MKGKINLSRREILISGAAGAAAVASGLIFSDRIRKQNIGFVEGGLFDLPNGNYIGNPMPAEAFANKAAFRWNPTSGLVQSVSISAPAHSIEAVPGTAHLSLAIPKNSNVLSLIDWRAKVEAQSLKQPDGELFYGHCGFNRDGSVAVISASKRLTLGELILCESSTLKKLGSILIPQGRPHQMARLSEKEFLVGLFNNAGVPSSLVIVDIESGRVDAVTLPYGDSHQRIVGHFVRLDSRRICWTANTFFEPTVREPSLVIFDIQTKAAEIHKFSGELAMGSIASTALDSKSEQIWFTLPELKSIIRFDLRERKVVERIQMPLVPWGLAFVSELQTLYAVSDGTIWQINQSAGGSKFESVAQAPGTAAMHAIWRPA